MTERVIDILSEFAEIEKEKLTVQSRLIADLGLNSLDVINMVVAFEEEFDIEIPDQDIKELTSVGDIVSYLETHI